MERRVILAIAVWLADLLTWPYVGARGLLASPWADSISASEEIS
jgi:hypothetical protein